MKHISVYLVQGVILAPRVELQMKTQCIDPINGNDIVFKFHGTNADILHRNFNLFFAIYDPRIAISSQNSHPNWKNDPFLKQAL